MGGGAVVDVYSGGAVARTNVVVADVEILVSTVAQIDGILQLGD